MEAAKVSSLDSNIYKFIGIHYGTIDKKGFRNPSMSVHLKCTGDQNNYAKEWNYN